MTKRGLLRFRFEPALVIDLRCFLQVGLREKTVYATFFGMRIHVNSFESVLRVRSLDRVELWPTADFLSCFFGSQTKG